MRITSYARKNSCGRKAYYNSLMRQSKISETSILETALIGLQYQLTEVDTKIADIRRQLGIRAPRVTSDGKQPKPARKRRRMSAAARKRIGEATRKRWAKYRANKAKSRGKG